MDICSHQDKHYLKQEELIVFFTKIALINLSNFIFKYLYYLSCSIHEREEHPVYDACIWLEVAFSKWKPLFHESDTGAVQSTTQARARESDSIAAHASFPYHYKVGEVFLYVVRDNRAGHMGRSNISSSFSYAFSCESQSQSQNSGLPLSQYHDYPLSVAF